MADDKPRLQAIDKNEFKQALRDLAKEEPEIFATAMADALGIEKGDLDGAIKESALIDLAKRGRKLLDEARSYSAQLLAVDRDAIEAERRKVLIPMEEALTARQLSHSGILANTEAIVAEIEAGRKAELPSLDELKAELEA